MIHGNAALYEWDDVYLRTCVDSCEPYGTEQNEDP
jgi:hypothetical protein